MLVTALGLHCLSGEGAAGQVGSVLPPSLCPSVRGCGPPVLPRSCRAPPVCRYRLFRRAGGGGWAKHPPCDVPWDVTAAAFPPPSHAEGLGAGGASTPDGEQAPAPSLADGVACSAVMAVGITSALLLHKHREVRHGGFQVSVPLEQGFQSSPPAVGSSSSSSRVSSSPG